MIRAFLAGIVMGACGVLLAGLLLRAGPSATDGAIDEQRASAERIQAERRVILEQSIVRAADDAERLSREVSEGHRRIREFERASQAAVGASDRAVVIVGELGNGIEKAYRLSEILNDAIGRLPESIRGQGGN